MIPIPIPGDLKLPQQKHSTEPISIPYFQLVPADFSSPTLS